tara:strand:+ start:337 stop:2772 length:2436 start_codon:yes stop_codon:yes gene_type:complete
MTMPKMILNYIFVSLVLLIPIACSPSSESPVLPEVASVNAPARTINEDVHTLQVFSPEKDGFGFKNFSGGSNDSSIKTKDLIDFFGENGICAQGSGGECSPYPGVIDFLDQLNLVLENGLCYGFSAMSSNLFTGNISIDKEIIFELERSKQTDHEIARWHMLQFTEEFRNKLDESITKYPLEIVSELQKTLSPNNGKLTTPVTLNLYSSNGAHSVTPISIEDFNSGFVIDVYDSNWPGQVRSIEVSNNGTWTYQGAHENPESQAGIWEESDKGSMALIPHTVQNDNFKCFFCEKTSDDLQGSGSVLILNTDSNQETTITVSDEYENSIIFGPDSSNIGIEDAKTYIMPGVTFGHGVKVIYLPPETSEFTVSLETNSKSDNEFTLLHSGNGNPTTTLKGTVPNITIQDDFEEDRDLQILEIKSSSNGDIQTVVASKSVTEVRQSTSLSTALYQSDKDEQYESDFNNGIINEVKITDIKTGEIIDSFNSSMDDIDVPLRSIKNEDGIQFIKSKDQALRLKFPDGTDISKTSERNYAVEYSDGIKSSFIKDSEGNIVGSFTDGATTIKLSSGESIHRTTDGIIIEEKTKGDYRIYKEKEDSITQIQSREEITKIEGLPPSLSDKLISITTSMNSIDKIESDPKRLMEIYEQIDIVKRAEKSLKEASNTEISEKILNDIQTPRVTIDSDPVIEEGQVETEKETVKDSIDRGNEDSVREEYVKPEDNVEEKAIIETERREPESDPDPVRNDPEIVEERQYLQPDSDNTNREPIIEEEARESTTVTREAERVEPTDTDRGGRETPSEDRSSRSRSRY